MVWTTCWRASQLPVCGRCQRRWTALLAQCLDTNMQFNKSLLLGNRWKIAVNSSLGRRSTGGMYTGVAFCWYPVLLSPTDGANEEAESLACSIMESLSSSRGRSGEVEAEEE